MVRTDIDNRMVRYLLGELDEEDQSRLEDQFFQDDDFFERLQMAKDQLVEDFLEGELSSAQRKRFEDHFLKQPGRREELELHRALIETIAGQAGKRPKKKKGLWKSIGLSLARLGRREFVPAAVSGAIILLLIGPWAFLRIGRLDAELARLESERQDWQERADQLEQEIDRLRAQIQPPASGVTSERVLQARLSPFEGLRSGASPTSIEVPGEVEWVRFEFEMSSGDGRVCLSASGRCHRGH